MSSADVYRNLRASLVAFCKNLIPVLQARFPQYTGGLSAQDFDTFQEEKDLPQMDCLGTAHTSFEVNNHVVSIETMIGVSTLADKNMFRLHDWMSVVFEAVRPGAQIPYLDADTGEVLGSFTILDGTRAMPVGGGNRPARFFVLTALLGVTIPG